MKIVAPVRNVSEVEALIDQGANELFCGVVPREWGRKFGFESPLNRRETATGNLSSYQALAEIVKEAHRRGVAVHVTMNAHYYTQMHYDSLVAILEGLSETGVDGFIVADVGLLLQIRKMNLPQAIIVSGDAMVTNTAAVELFGELGATRIILPRQVTIREISRIAEERGGMEFESFMFSDDCFFSGGMCNTIHHVSKDIFCREFLERSHYSGSAANVERLINANLTLAYFSKMKGVMCGICSIRSLRKAGVSYLKIAGRTADLEYRLAGIFMVRSAVQSSQEDMDDQEMLLRMVGLRWGVLGAASFESSKLSTELCMLGNCCYYPDDEILVTARDAHYRAR
jgi:putative protease